MYRLWRDVATYERPGAGLLGGDAGGAYELNDLRLNKLLDVGHSALESDDDDANVIEAMLVIRDTLNSDRDVWPETHGMTEAEWAEMYAAGDRIRAARAAAAVEAEA